MADALIDIPWAVMLIIFPLAAGIIAFIWPRIAQTLVLCCNLAIVLAWRLPSRTRWLGCATGYRVICRRTEPNTTYRDLSGRNGDQCLCLEIFQQG